MARRRNFVNRASMVLSNGTTLNLEPQDFRLNGNTIIDDLVDGNDFCIGTVLGKTVTITIDNTHERFTRYNFYGAYFWLFVGLPLNDDGTNVEWIRIGKFTVITPVTSGTLINIEAVDEMYKFDRSYADIHTSYPATLGGILNDICSYCGITNNTGYFAYYSLPIAERPEGDFTCRQIISFIAQIACVDARIDEYGSLRFFWYEDYIPSAVDNLDGGNFRPIYKPSGAYDTGDDADGGTFRYDDGDSYDGGTFREGITYHNLESAKGVTVSTDNIYFTGVEVKSGTASSESTPSNGTTVQSGSSSENEEEGGGGQEEEKNYYHIIAPAFEYEKAYYVGDIVSVWSTETEYTLYQFIEDHAAYSSWDSTQVNRILDYDIIISDNPFTLGYEEEIATSIFTKLQKFTFRPFSLSYLQDPTIESGDWVWVTDIKRNTYLSVATNVTFTTGGYMAISCKAQSPAQQLSVYSSAAAKAVAKTIEMTVEKLNSWERELIKFNNLMNAAMGLFSYQRVSDKNGGVIYYLSNKPIEEETDEKGNLVPRFVGHAVVWRMSDTGFSICFDVPPEEPYDILDDPSRGCIWANGWDVTGHIQVNSLSTINMSFSWCRGGELLLGGDGNGNGVLIVYNAYDYVRARLDNEGLKIGHIGVSVDSEGHYIPEQGSMIFIDTEGQMQYWFNGIYSGKMVMEKFNYGTNQSPDYRDALSIEDFDNINLNSDNNNAYIRISKTGAHDEYGYIIISADATYEENPSPIPAGQGSYKNYNGVVIDSRTVYLGTRVPYLLDNDAPIIHLNGRVNVANKATFKGETEFKNGVYLDTNADGRLYVYNTQSEQYEHGLTEEFYAFATVNNSTVKFKFREGILTTQEYYGKHIIDFWHSLTVVLLPGNTTTTFDNLPQAPSGETEYGYEPFIKPPSGVNAPKITDISQSGNSITIYYTEITEEQAGTQLRIRVIV